jgi:hypothetical protein
MRCATVGALDVIKKETKRHPFPSLFGPRDMPINVIGGYQPVRRVPDER